MKKMLLHSILIYKKRFNTAPIPPKRSKEDKLTTPPTTPHLLSKVESLNGTRLAQSGSNKRANREEQTKNSIQQLSTHQVHGGTLPSCANKFLFYE